jgi:hypothetical protein
MKYAVTLEVQSPVTGDWHPWLNLNFHASLERIAQRRFNILMEGLACHPEYKFRGRMRLIEEVTTDVSVEWPKFGSMAALLPSFFITREKPTDTIALWLTAIFIFLLPLIAAWMTYPGAPV